MTGYTGYCKDYRCRKTAECATRRTRKITTKQKWSTGGILMNLIYHGRAPRIVCRRSERPANTIRGPSLRALQNTVSHGWRESGSKVAIRRWFWHVNMTVHTGVESDMLSCAVLQRHGTIVEQAEESSNITGSCEIWFLEECQVPPCYTSC